jgi:hypothetical protein
MQLIRNPSGSLRRSPALHNQRAEGSWPHRRWLQIIIVVERTMFLGDENTEREGEDVMYSKVNRLPRCLLPESNQTPPPSPVEVVISPHRHI